MTQEKNDFFLKQIKLQKQRLIAFIPALGFVLGMLYAKTTGHDRPLYIFVLVTMYLTYGLVFQSLVNAKIIGRTIESFTILKDKKVEFFFFQPIIFKQKPITIDSNNAGYTDRNLISKKDIFKLEPTIEITTNESNSTYFFFPSCFENGEELERLLGQPK